MKKLRYVTYVVALMFTVGLVACTSSTKKTEEKVETPTEQVVEEPVIEEAVTDSLPAEETPATEEVVEEAAE